MRAGDLVLTHGTGLVDRAIQFGQGLRYPLRHARWNHAAVAISPTLVCEAVAGGVRIGGVAGYVDRAVVPLHLAGEPLERCLDYLHDCLGERYDWTEIAGAVAFLATGRRVRWTVPHEAICSVLAASALQAAGVALPLPPAEMLPADLAARFL